VNIGLRFGPELRARRLRSGITLTELAAAVTYDKGYLSKVERGRRRASIEVARRCDDFLGARGELQRLAEAEAGESGAVAISVHTDQIPPPIGRRAVLAVGAGAFVGVGPGDGTPGSVHRSAPVFSSFRAQFDQLRLLGQSTAPAALLPLLETQTRTVAWIASGESAERTGLLRLASRFAEYTGWIAQEAGKNGAALVWTAEAVELAQAGGDRHLAAYALVRRALVTLYGADPAQTIALARRAQAADPPARIRGLAAQREAQGHALAGDERACLRSLDRAQELLVTDDTRDKAEPVIGTSTVGDPAAMTRGWCLYDLGRPKAAADVLDRECLRLPPEALRTRTRYGIRRALAHAAAGEIDHSCRIAAELLEISGTVPSATVATDIRRLAHELGRFRAHRSVRELQPALARALASTG
jgi:transcriptional regulator with XRE-family HTH domain